MVLSFCHLAFCRIVELIRLFGRDREDLAVEVVVLRHESAITVRAAAVGTTRHIHEALPSDLMDYAEVTVIRRAQPGA